MRPTGFAYGIFLAAVLMAPAAAHATQPPGGVEPVPARLVVLTFDDACRSHFEYVRPLLLEYGFGATFFVTDAFRDEHPEACMTWDQIAQLHRDGFEIGNHTRDHLPVREENLAQLEDQLEWIAERCREHGIPVPVTFAYPGNAFDPAALGTLQDNGILFARRGGAPEHAYEEGRGFAYEIGLDHPLLIPSSGDARPDWDQQDFIRAVSQARNGRVAVLQFHGVPDRLHPWVSTSPEHFRRFCDYLQREDFRVIALRDLQDYVPAGSEPRDPEFIMQDRLRARELGRSRDNTRTPADESERLSWLTNMVVDHGFAVSEVAAATGLSPESIERDIERWSLRDLEPSTFPDRLKVLPYPGGRHPRIGFRDGMVRPQRETKFSVFLPWDPAAYVVVDLPEAIWHEGPAGRELLFLGHTHVPTIWDRLGIPVDKAEWETADDGSLRVERRLPNGVRFGARVEPAERHVDMTLWLHNGSEETLRGLRVQNCVMLGGAPGFATQTNDNKHLEDPVAACLDGGSNRWVAVVWQHCVRAWGNVHCPCLHSDPQFPDCPPGETRELRGRLWFPEGGADQPPEAPAGWES